MAGMLRNAEKASNAEPFSFSSFWDPSCKQVGVVTPFLGL